MMVLLNTDIFKRALVKVGNMSKSKTKRSRIQQERKTKTWPNQVCS